MEGLYGLGLNMLVPDECHGLLGTAQKDIDYLFYKNLLRIT